MSMLTRFYQIMSADNNVKALFGSEPVRIYPNNPVMDKNPRKPYAVYGLFNVTPYNYLHGRCDMDMRSVQVDIYADTSAIVENCLETIRTTLEAAGQGYLMNYSTPARDSETGLFRVTLEIDFHEER
jgi:hypothetical protein